MSLYEDLKRLAVATGIATEGKNDHDWAVKALKAMGVTSAEAEKAGHAIKAANPFYRWIRQ